MPENEQTFTTSEAAGAVGVSPEALRSWERRYGFPMPTRTKGGHRRYTAADVERLRALGAIQRTRRTRVPAEIVKELDREPPHSFIP